MPKGKKDTAICVMHLNGLRRLSGSTYKIKSLSSSEQHIYYGGRTAPSLNGERGKTYGEIIKEKLTKQNDSRHYLYNISNSAER